MAGLLHIRLKILHSYTHLHNLSGAYTQAHALRPGFAIDLFHQIKGCWSHYRSGLSHSWACRCRRQMCLAAFLTPQGLLTPSHGERNGISEWICIGHVIPSVMMSCIHQAAGTICFCLTVLRLQHLGWWMLWCHFRDAFFGSMMHFTCRNSLKYDMIVSNDLVMTVA